METFPTLYKKTSTGKIQVWKIWVAPAADVDCYAIINEYGVLNGKMQRAVDVIREGKNVGKVNETTPYEQAVAEARSEWEGKKKKHYVESIEEAEAGQVDSTFVAGGVKPMLAHKYHEQGHKIKYPAFVQPKLDGHRCIAVIQDGKASLWSRTQKRITSMPHVEAALELLAATHPNGPMNMVLDGELYNHDYHNRFEDLSSMIRKATPQPGCEVVQYWIYDVVVDLPFSERNAMLESFETLIKSYGLGTVLGILATFEVADEEAMLALTGEFIANNYEGAIVRNAATLYENKRSYGLQKVKQFEDAEFEIVDVEEGRGNMAGRAIFVCLAPNGERFNAKMQGNLDNLSQIWQERENYIGKQLTVKYQGWYESGVPRFPVGIRLREDI